MKIKINHQWRYSMDNPVQFSHVVAGKKIIIIIVNKICNKIIIIIDYGCLN